MISVIIPIYNAENYLSECIESVINQTYQDWELLLVDDESSDSSPRICKKYANGDPRISYHLVHHKGVSEVRNVGIEQARGEYLFFMDADDYLTLDALALLWEKMENDKEVAVVCAECKAVMADSTAYPNSRPAFDDELIDNHRFLCDIFIGNTLCAVWAKLYRHSILENHRFVVGLNRAEDIMYHITVFSQEKCKILRCANPIYNYRILSNSISHSKNTGKQINQLRNYMQTVKNFMNIHPLVEEEYRKEYSYNMIKNVLHCIELQGINKRVEDWHIETINEFLPKCHPMTNKCILQAIKIVEMHSVFAGFYLTFHYLPSEIKAMLRPLRNKLMKPFIKHI